MNAKDFAEHAFTSFHRGVYKVSGGRLGGKGAGMPVVILTTTGRKSGAKRQTMLTSPVIEGDTVVLVASHGGDDRNPAWFLNLRDDLDVELVLHNEKRLMTATVATAEEKAALWPRVLEANPGYGGYQEKTDREIPVVLLNPR